MDHNPIAKMIDHPSMTRREAEAWAVERFDYLTSIETNTTIRTKGIYRMKVALIASAIVVTLSIAGMAMTTTWLVAGYTHNTGVSTVSDQAKPQKSRIIQVDGGGEG